jgi:hypothetical protein
MKKYPNNRRILSILALLGLLASVPAEAVSLYKWVDENGHVHYSQTPPETSSVQSEQMQVKDKAPYTQQDQEGDSATPTTTAEGAKVVDARKRNCEVARMNLESYRSSDQIQQPDGTVITLSEEMRASKIKETQAQINAYCN